MNEPILATRGLAKQYGRFTALQPTSLAVERGQIYGLVGKNGAGKTTLMRLVTGQALPTVGELELFGKTTPSGLNGARRRTGAMIETPSFYPYLTAAQNLEYYRIQRGVTGKGCVPELLKTVELADAGSKKFKDFSLGMKQRLGLALALLDHPDLLILDEPINGLDPMGIVGIRSLLLRLNREQGVTILISSHILSELASLATDYGFLDHGVLLEQVSAPDLQAKCRQYLEVAVNDPKLAAVILERDLACTEFEALPDGTLRLYRFLDEPGRVAAALVAGGLLLNGIEVKGSNLEDYFLRLIGGELHA